jgi:hypothetical protein
MEGHDLAPRALSAPSAARLPPDAPRRDEILAAHATALAAGNAAYRDPATGLAVFSAAFLARRGACCSSGCRHCPYTA